MYLRRWVTPCITAVSFLLNFVFADLEETLVRYDSLFSPIRTAYIMWAIVYGGLFGFVVYQLCCRSARESNLIQRKIPIPWVVHQFMVAAWLLAFSRQMILTATIASSLQWLCSLVIYVLVTTEFRNGIYLPYHIEDFLLIEIPFALLVGWETFTTLLSWNVLAVKMTRQSAFARPSVELAMFIISIALLSQGAVFFAGLPTLMNPFLHLPVFWGLLCIAWRWLVVEQTAGDVSTACGIAALAIAIICWAYFMFSVSVMCSSKFCLPEQCVVEEPVFVDTNVPSQSVDHRTPKTARSAFSVERMV